MFSKYRDEVTDFHPRFPSWNFAYFTFNSTILQKVHDFHLKFHKVLKSWRIFNPWMSHISQPWYLTDGPRALFPWNWGWLRAEQVHNSSWGPSSVLLVYRAKTGLFNSDFWGFPNGFFKISKRVTGFWTWIHCNILINSLLESRATIWIRRVSVLPRSARLSGIGAKWALSVPRAGHLEQNTGRDLSRNLWEILFLWWIL